MYNAIRFHLCLIVEVEDNRVSKFILVRAQRADIVTKSFWKHRYGTIHEIDTCSTFLCLFVDNRAFRDIMADIGDMNTYFPQSVIETLNTEGIIEILCIVRVNSTGENIAEIFTTGDFIGRNLIAYLIGCIFHSLWIFIWKSVLSKNSVHLCIVVALLSEDIDNTSHDASVLCIRPFYYLNHGSVTILGILQLALWNEDADGHRVSRNEISHFTVSLDNADKLVLCPLDNLNYLCLADMLCTTCHH